MAVERSKVGIRKRGFTLIEVMIALTIFSVGILSIIGMLIIGGTGIAGGNRSFTAVQTAKAQMELLHGYFMPDTLNDVCSTLSTSIIQCVWSVKKGVPAEGLSTIEVVTTWHEGEKKRQLILSTLRFDGNE